MMLSTWGVQNVSQFPASRRVADTTTGEVHLVEKEKRASYGFGKDDEGKRHMVIGAVAARELVRTDYPVTVFRVLLYIMQITDETCVIKPTQQQIADEVGISRVAVARAVSRLIKDGHLYRDGSVLHLNPLTAFTGTGAEHQKAIARLPVDMQPSAPVRHLKPVD